MAYATYITDALVCGAKDSNTSDKSFLLFTREAGMLFASARSVREERSRQRFALQDFTHVRVSLIKGKTGWRIGSVEPLRNYYAEAVDKEARGSVAKIFRQLRRFIHGEEAAIELFDYTIKSLRVISSAVSDRLILDNLIQLQFLNLLGYVSQKDIPEKLLDMTRNLSSAELSKDQQKVLTRVLDRAVSASHL